jgi:hypothetical protein
VAFKWVRIWIIASPGVSKILASLFLTRIDKEVGCIYSNIFMKISRTSCGCVCIRAPLIPCRVGASSHGFRRCLLALSCIPVVMACVCCMRNIIWVRRHLTPFVLMSCQVLTPVLHLLCISGRSAAAPCVLKTETRLAPQEQAFPKHLSSLPTGIPPNYPWGCVWHEYLWRHGLEIAQYIPQVRYIAW